MRVSTLVLSILPLVLTASGVQAAGIVMPQAQSSGDFGAYHTLHLEQPWASQVPVPRLAEQPIGEVISSRLGLVGGSAELFRYQVEGAPSNKTVLDGLIDGGGIKLKLTW